MNSLDTDGNGKGEEQSRRGDLETEKRGGGGGEGWSLSEFMSGVPVVKFTVAPLYHRI